MRRKEEKKNARKEEETEKPPNRFLNFLFQLNILLFFLIKKKENMALQAHDLGAYISVAGQE